MVISLELNCKLPASLICNLQPLPGLWGLEITSELRTKVVLLGKSSSSVLTASGSEMGVKGFE